MPRPTNKSLAEAIAFSKLSDDFYSFDEKERYNENDELCRCAYRVPCDGGVLCGEALGTWLS